LLAIGLLPSSNTIRKMFQDKIDKELLEVHEKLDKEYELQICKLEWIKTKKNELKVFTCDYALRDIHYMIFKIIKTIKYQYNSTDLYMIEEEGQE